MSYGILCGMVSRAAWYPCYYPTGPELGIPILTYSARVVLGRACAVGVARWGAQMGRLGAPWKAGERWYYYSPPHGCRCMSPRATVAGAIGGPVGRAARRLETGKGPLPFANRAGCKRRKIQTNAHGSWQCGEQAGPVAVDGTNLERATCDELMQVPVTWVAWGEPASRASG